jgi:hypothetical protein
VIGAGVAVAVVGVSGGGALSGVAMIGAGVAVVVLGVSLLIGVGTLFGVAVIGGGVAAAAYGGAVLAGGSTGRRARAWWDRVTSDPAELPDAGGPQPDGDAGPAQDPASDQPGLGQARPSA